MRNEQSLESSYADSKGPVLIRAFADRQNLLDNCTDQHTDEL